MSPSGYLALLHLPEPKTCRSDRLSLRPRTPAASSPQTQSQNHRLARARPKANPKSTAWRQLAPNGSRFALRAPASATKPAVTFLLPVAEAIKRRKLPSPDSRRRDRQTVPLPPGRRAVLDAIPRPPRLQQPRRPVINLFFDLVNRTRDLNTATGSETSSEIAFHLHEFADRRRAANGCCKLRPGRCRCCGCCRSR
jgi:hypothetical protein